jgi:hypothetical protein
METAYYIAGIDVNKNMLAWDTELHFSSVGGLGQPLASYHICRHGCETPPCRTVWVALEGQCRLRLAQARSIR